MTCYPQNQMLAEALRTIGGLKQSLQATLEEVARVEKCLMALQLLASETSTSKSQDIDEDDYAVILDMTTGTLRFRKNPAKRTPLVLSKHEKVGAHRMRILAHMLEHPGTQFHAGNIYEAYGSEPERREADTFTKTIGALRKALGQTDTTGPYIITDFDWQGITGTKRGCVYEINPNWRYLVIRQRPKMSEQIPL